MDGYVILKARSAVLGMTRYEQIKSMTKDEMELFLYWFGLCQIPERFIERVDLDKFNKEIKEFLSKEIDFDECDSRTIII